MFWIIKVCVKNIWKVEKNNEFNLENPFRKLKFTTYIYKQKKRQWTNYVKIILVIQRKWVLVGFGNWNSQKDSIIRGHRRGPVVAFIFVSLL